MLRQSCEQISCDLEIGLCGWRNLNQAKFVRGPASRSVALRDHTQQSALGNVLYLGDNLPPSSSVILRKDFTDFHQDYDREQCFSFWIYVADSDRSLKFELSHFTVTFHGMRRQTLWNQISSLPQKVWSRVQQSISFNNANRTLELIAQLPKKITKGTGLVLDDLNLKPYACSRPIDCDFASGNLCGWSMKTYGNDYTFKLGFGRIFDPSVFTHYKPELSDAPLIYTDFTTESFNLRRNSAEMVSEVVPRGGCFTMDWDCHYSTSADLFGIYVENINGNRTPLWQWDHKQSSQPLKIYLEKNSHEAEVRLVIRAEVQQPEFYARIRSVSYTIKFTKCGSVKGSTVTSTTSSAAPTVTPSKSPNCDFEMGTLCHWASSSGAIKAFQVDKLEMSISTPSGDHTTFSKRGYIASVDNSVNYSPTMEIANPFKGGQRICFGFYYYLEAESASPDQNHVMLKFYRNRTLPPTTLFHAFASNVHLWREAKVEFDVDRELASDSKFSMEIYNPVGIVGIDDIKVQEGGCDEGSVRQGWDFCNFELGNHCFYQPVYNSDIFQWKLYNGTQAGIVDHSSYTSTGHMYGIKEHFSSKRVIDQVFEIGTPGLREEVTFQFSYNLGLNTTLVVEYDPGDGGGRRPMFSTTGQTYGLWYTHRMCVSSHLDYYTLRIGLVGTRSGINGFIDDVLLLDQHCSTSLLLCTFDDGDTCQLESSHGYDTIVPDQASTLTLLPIHHYQTYHYVTGYVDSLFAITTSQYFDSINGDHTQNSPEGKFLLLSISANQGTHRAILVSQRYEVSHYQLLPCFTFAWQTSGASVLELYQMESGLNDTGLKLWENRIDSTSWKVMKISPILKYPQNPTYFSFFLIGTVGITQGVKSYIALDDVGFLPHDQCNHSVTPSTEFHCADGSGIIEMGKVCDWKQDCKDGSDERNCGSCNFAQNWCNYTQRNDNPEDRPYRFRLPDQAPVGPVDGSNYIVASQADRTNSDPNRIVKIISPTIQKTYADCTLSFDYQYSADQTYDSRQENQAFEVKINLNALNRLVTLWQSSTQQFKPKQWYSITYPLQVIHRSFQVIFEAHSIGTPNSFHALGNVELKCPERETPYEVCPKLPDSKFHCKNLYCIPLEKWCDFVDDCGDNSDEEECDSQHRTDFEQGLGLWNEDVPLWLVKEVNPNAELRNSPTFDHTTGYTGGHYIIAKPESQFRKFSLLSPVFTPSGANCRLILYVMKNTENSTLVFKKLNLKTGLSEILETITYAKNMFEFKILEFQQENAQLYKIYIIAEFPDPTQQYLWPYIALDDIGFSTDCTVFATSATLAPKITTVAPPDACEGLRCSSAKNNSQICVLPNQFCDFIQDCKNGDDEMKCGQCDFDHVTSCQWRNVGRNDQPWMVWSEASLAARTEPHRDGSNNASGGYLITRQSGSYQNFYAKIRSPEINSVTSPLCTLEFQYSSTSNVEFSFGITGEKNKLSRFSTQPNSEWQSLTWLVGQQSPPFSIELQTYTVYSTVGYSAYTYVAIDNLKMVNCEPKKIDRNQPKEVQDFACDFENNLCQWMVANGTNWQRTNEKLPELYDEHGFYMYTFGSQNNESNFFQSIYPLEAHSNTPFCLSFYYSFYGFHLGNFSLNLLPKWNNLAGELAWQRTLPDTRSWRQVFIEISPTKTPLYLTFMTHLKEGSVVTLDQIKLSNSSCPTRPDFCDFEINTCDWQKVSGDFHRERGADHTTNSESGHFLTDSAGKSVIRKNFSALPFWDESDENRMLCLDLYARITPDPGKKFDDTSSSLTIVHHSAIYKQILRAYSIEDAYNYDLLGQWMEIRTAFSAYSSDWLEIRLNRTLQSTQIHLDDIGIDGMRCQEQGNCDFENGMCGWNNVINHNVALQILWIRFQLPVQAIQQNRHPNCDHTKGTDCTGNFLLLPIEAQRRGQALLRSPLIFKHSEITCFRMYYFARVKSGKNSAPIIWFSVFAGGNSKNPFLKRLINGTNSLEWTKFEIDIRHGPSEIYFELQSYPEVYTESDVGLDDIQILNVACNNPERFTSTTPIPKVERALDCDFEHADQCHWKYSKTAWKVNSYSQHKNPYDPQEDHTHGAKWGHYLLLNKYQSAQVSSTQNLPYTHDHCLTLWYYSDGESPYGITFHWGRTRSEITVNSIVTEISSNMENRVWQVAKVDYLYDPTYNSSGFKIYFTVYVMGQGQNFSKFAIDDIAVRPGRCSHQNGYTYTFEGDLEDLVLEHVQPVTSEVGRIVHLSKQPIPTGVPKTDHTTRSSLGSYFLFMNNNDDQFHTHYIDTLSMMDLPADHQQSCVRFAVQSYGNVTFQVYGVNSQNQLRHTDLQWNLNFPMPHWSIIELNTKIWQAHRLVFRMSKVLDKTSFVALDDLTVLDHPCLPPIDCDFQHHRYCSYTPYQPTNGNHSNELNFEVFTAPPVEPNFPGPEYDHTYRQFPGGGYLIFSAYRYPKKFKQLTASVISGVRQIYNGESYCLTLWTILCSNDSAMTITLLGYGSVQGVKFNQTHVIAKLENNFQTKWTSLNRTLDQKILWGMSEIQILIEGHVGSDPIAAVALDDISLTLGKCATEQFYCEDGKALKQEQLCNYVRDCPSGIDENDCGNCDFETGQCGWSNDSTSLNNTIQWLRVSALNARHYRSMAPLTDGSNNRKGHYMIVYKRSSEYVEIPIAQMSINQGHPVLQKAYKTCVVQFDYYVNTTGRYFLQFRLSNLAGGGTGRYSIQHESNTNGQWQTVNVLLEDRYPLFYLIMRAFQEDNGIIALDNVRYLNCTQPNPLPKGQKCNLTSKPILCPNTRICIDKEDMCDFVNDCGDSWDEINCDYYLTPCHFSSGTCDITEDQNNRYVAWTVTSNSNHETAPPFVGFQPPFDHTFQISTGQYYLLEVVQKLPENFTAKQLQTSFYTPMLTSHSNQPCSLRFFYYFNSNQKQINKIQLQIYVRYATKLVREPKPLISITGSDEMQQRWIKTVASCNSTQPFQFVVQGTLANELSGLAVDDISYGFSCQRSNVKPMTTTTTTTTTTRKPTTITTTKMSTFITTKTSTSKISTHSETSSKPLTTTSQTTQSHITTTESSPTTTTFASTTSTSLPIKRHKTNINHAGAIVAGILVPVLVISLVVIGWFGYRRYRARLGYIEANPTLILLKNIAVNDKKLMKNEQL